MKNNPGPKITKGNNLREIIICAGWGYRSFVFFAQF